MECKERGITLLKDAKTVLRYDVVARLETVVDPTDTVASDTRVHKTCATKLYTAARSIKRLREKSGKEFQHPSWFEPTVFEKLVETVRYSEKPMRLSVLIKQYIRELADNGIETKDLYVHPSRFKDELFKKLKSIGKQFSSFSDGREAIICSDENIGRILAIISNESSATAGDSAKLIECGLLVRRLLHDKSLPEFRGTFLRYCMKIPFLWPLMTLLDVVCHGMDAICLKGM